MESIVVRAIFHTPSGDRREIDAQCGVSLMESAKAASVEGIDADCGGSMVCGTCHIHVSPEWLERLPAPEDMEATILDCVPDPHPQARLSCQIVVTPEMDGIEVIVPTAQR
nr:2Fe-2S iron-sulfur cluster-binding protein [Sphingobium sp. EM0848]